MDFGNLFIHQKYKGLITFLKVAPKATVVARGIFLLFTFIVTGIYSQDLRAKIVEEGYVVDKSDTRLFQIIKEMPELTLDHVGNDHYEVWGPKGLGKWLESTNVRFQSADYYQTNLGKATPSFPSHLEITNSLKTLAKDHPETAKLFSIGNSTQNRELWVMKISRNVTVDDDRPEFKYIANMHGDEIIGRELMMRLIRDLLENDGKDPVVTKLLDQVQIYIMPSMNPDGAAARTRGNARYIDLNRDFPEFSQNEPNTPEGRAIETQLVMAWQSTRKFKLSANYHGGAEVVNYPWDAIPDKHPKEPYLKKICLDYAKLAPYIGASTAFHNGITNGYEWYEVLGGMQDWSFIGYKDLQLTIEVSNTKWPAVSTTDYYWKQNRPAMINLIEEVLRMP